MIDSLPFTPVLWLSLIPAVPTLLIVFRDIPLLHAVIAVVLLWILKGVVQKLLGIPKITDLERRAVFITGCDTGFGRLLTLKCLKAGMPVFAGCVTEQGAQSLRDDAKGLRGRLDTIIVDVSNDESVHKAAEYLEKTTEQYGGLHAVVNNAGIVGSSYLDDLLTTNDYRKVVEVNTFGVIRVTHAVKHLVKKARGRVVAVASVFGRLGLFGTGPYTISKFAVNAYCDVIRQELALFGVSVHILEPGFFRTHLIDKGNTQGCMDEMWKNAPEKAKEEYGEEYFMESRGQIVEFLYNIGSDRVDLVVDAYFHAVTARFPQLRYHVGVDFQFVYLPVSVLPSGMIDAIFSLIRKLRRFPVPTKAIEKYSKKLL